MREIRSHVTGFLGLIYGYSPRPSFRMNAAATTGKTGFIRLVANGDEAAF